MCPQVPIIAILSDLLVRPVMMAPRLRHLAGLEAFGGIVAAQRRDG